MTCPHFIVCGLSWYDSKVQWLRWLKTLGNNIVYGPQFWLLAAFLLSSPVGLSTSLGQAFAQCDGLTVARLFTWYPASIKEEVEASNALKAWIWNSQTVSFILFHWEKQVGRGSQIPEGRTLTPPFDGQCVILVYGRKVLMEGRYLLETCHTLWSC